MTTARYKIPSSWTAMRSRFMLLPKRLWGSSMPNWELYKRVHVIGTDDHEWQGDFDVSVSPRGIRGAWLVGKILRQLPFFTGSSPFFHVKVTRLASKAGREGFSVSLLRFRSTGHAEDEPRTFVINSDKLEPIYERDFKDNPISFSGENRYVLYIGVGVADETLEILSFKAVDKDFFRLLIYLLF